MKPSSRQRINAENMNVTLSKALSQPFECPLSTVQKNLHFRAHVLLLVAGLRLGETLTRECRRMHGLFFHMFVNGRPQYRLQ